VVVVSFFRYFYVGVSVVLINLFWTFKYFIYGIYSFLKFLFSLFVFFGKGVSVSIKPITEIPDKIEENKLKKMKEKRDEELFEASKIKYGYSEL